MKGFTQSRLFLYLILFLLILSTAFAYWNIDKCDFISLDDHQYVLKNHHVMFRLQQKKYRMGVYNI